MPFRNHWLTSGAGLAMLLLTSACSDANREKEDSADEDRAELTAMVGSERSVTSSAPARARKDVGGAPSPTAVEEPESDHLTQGDGSPILLSSLSPAEIEGAGLAGELGCDFRVEPSSVLLIAKGDVASPSRARGIVKVGDSVEPVAAAEAGGFDAMLDGTTFVGQGKTIRIAVSPEGPSGAGESPPVRATLTYQRPDGASRRLLGIWTCGP
jgi:hypothetical protein